MNRIGTRLPIALVVLGVSLWATSLAAPAAPEGPQAATSPGVGPRLVAPAQPVMATGGFQWNIALRVVNPTGAGIYVDSLRFEVRDLDEGTTRRSRIQSTMVRQVAELLHAVSAGDSGILRYSGAALCEHGRLNLRLYSHDSDHRLFTSDDTLEVTPGGISRSLTSLFLKEQGRRLEYVFVPEVWPQGRSPGVLLIHGEGSHARQWLPLAWELANHGYATMVVSLPSYGRSSGPGDFAGPATLKWMNRALNVLRRLPDIDSTRVAVWGVSQGATVAALLAGQRPDLKAAVLQSGLYDLETAFRQTTSDELRRLIQSDAGPRGPGWQRRSPLSVAGKIGVPVLLLHGEQDGWAPTAQAADYATSLRAAGKNVTVQLFPETGHSIPISEVRAAAHAFLKPYLTPTPHGRE